MFARGDGCAIAVPPCFGLLPGISARVPAWVGGRSSLAGRMSRFQPRRGLSCLRTGRGATASRVIPIRIQYTCPAAPCQVWRGGFAVPYGDGKVPRDGIRRSWNREQAFLHRKKCGNATLIPTMQEEGEAYEKMEQPVSGPYLAAAPGRGYASQCTANNAERGDTEQHYADGVSQYTEQRQPTGKFPGHGRRV